MNPTVPEHMLEQPRRCSVRVIELRRLSPTGFELTLERGGLRFAAGQLITIHGRELLEDRSYTIASGESDDHLKILFRLMPAGKLTPQLVGLRPGDAVEVSGPFGEFTLRDPQRANYFVATGTGIAPCRAYIRTHGGLKLTVVHGVRQASDLFYRQEFQPYTYQACVSGEPAAGFHGRVTDYFRQIPIDTAAHFYLCGANEMFYEMRDVLEERGVKSSSIFTEAYYYRSDT